MRRIAAIVAATLVALGGLLSAAPSYAAGPPTPKPSASHCPPGHGNYPPKPCRMQTDKNEAAPGESVTVQGEGFTPNCTVTISLGARPIGTTQTDANGDFTQQVTIPSDAKPGGYQLTATDCSGAVLGEQFRVTDEQGGESSSGGHVGKGGQQSSGGGVRGNEHGRLPFTGVVFYPLLGAAVVLLGGGLMLIVVGRRRRHTALAT
jgi:hypothetical protein